MMQFWALIVDSFRESRDRKIFWVMLVIELATAAIAALPAIQRQQYDAMARPYRVVLVRYLLAARDETRAAIILKQVLEGANDKARQRRSAEAAKARDHEATERISRAIADAYVGLVEQFRRWPPQSRPPIGDYLAAAIVHEPADARAWAWRVWLAAEAGATEAIEAALRDAAAAGVSAADVRRIRSSLGHEFPALRDFLSPTSQPR